MPDVDFYKILEVSREATDDEIRKAYKKLARKYHPDVQPNDKEAEQKFKQIQEAYAVLGDRDKREQYDRYGSAFEGSGPFPEGFRWAGGRPGGQPVDLEDLFGGAVDISSILGGGFGQSFGGAGRRSARKAKGQDVRTEIDIPFLVAAQGGKEDLVLNRDGKPERLSVTIPAGIESGTTIRLSGQGAPSPGGKPGDLLVTVNVHPHPWFRREDDNLLVDVPVTPAEAALGAKVEVPTLSEGPVVLTVPPGTSSGVKLRLRGKGVRNPKSGARGDQFVVIKIVVPRQIDDETRRLYEQIRARESTSPRAGLW